MVESNHTATAIVNKEGKEGCGRVMYDDVHTTYVEISVVDIFTRGVQLDKCHSSNGFFMVRCDEVARSYWSTHYN